MGGRPGKAPPSTDDETRSVSSSKGNGSSDSIDKQGSLQLSADRNTRCHDGGSSAAVVLHAEPVDAALHEDAATTNDAVSFFHGNENGPDGPGDVRVETGTELRQNRQDNEAIVRLCGLPWLVDDKINQFVVEWTSQADMILDTPEETLIHRLSTKLLDSPMLRADGTNFL